MSPAAPNTVAEVIELIESARSDHTPLWFAGSGTVDVPEGSLPVPTSGLSGIVDYKPDDLTITVRAGTTLRELNHELAPNRLTAVLPETEPDRTVGGVVATGSSGYRRLRYGPTRDRVIGVSLVTGYGELVHGGGQLVKNVTGFDLPRLVTGSHGALGFIAEVSLKLWPMVTEAVTVQVDDVSQARLDRYQPIAAIETEHGGFLSLSGAGTRDSDFTWPEPITDPTRVAVNVPPRLIVEGIKRTHATGANRFIAQHGVGVVDAGWTHPEAEDIVGLREWAESIGGSLVVHRRGSLPDAVSRWGSPSASIGIQHRLKELFDPDAVCNPGVLPGGV